MVRKVQGQLVEVVFVVGWFVDFHIEGWDDSSNSDDICWWTGQGCYCTYFGCEGWLHKLGEAH